MAIRKPSSISSTVNPPSGSTLIKQSGGTFVMKMWDYDFYHSLHSHAEITGDGDANPVYDHNQMQNGRYILRGASVAAVAIGLANLSGSSNPGPVKLKLDSTADAGTFHNVTALVLSVRGKWRRTAVFIPLIIDCILTSTTPANIEAST